ncbi:MAG: hypothetical protein ACE5J4_03405 [Candidatus Aenigmatarchaeota archaeon]
MVEMGKILEILHTKEVERVYESGRLSDLSPDYHSSDVDENDRLSICIRREFEGVSPPPHEYEIKTTLNLLHLTTEDGSMIGIRLGEKPNVFYLNHYTEECLRNIKKAMDHGLTVSKKYEKELEILEESE